MRSFKNMTFAVFRPGAPVPLTIAAACALTAFGQTIPNPSFEANTFATAPGYVSDNTPITGWTAEPNTGAGLNPAGGASDFANNGAVPDGANVAFLSAAGSTLSTTLSGLTAGKTYKVEFRANANTNDTGVALSPLLRVSIDTQEALALNIYAAGGSSPYGYVAFEFNATAATHTMTLVNDATDESTLLLDNFKIALSSGKWSVTAWTGDADSGIDPSYVYTHAYSFGSSGGTVINGIPFTGVEGGNPKVADKFTTTYLGNVFANDANNITGGSAGMARDFVYGGNVPAGNFQSIALAGLTPGAEYVVTIYSVGFDSPSPAIRWATVSVGEDRLTINQDQFDNNNGIRFSYRYTADASGTATVRIAPVNAGNVSVHVYGFSNREAVSRNVAPAIAQQPSSTTVSQGLPVRFSVLASGFPAPTYRWRFNGADVPNATTLTLDVAQASAQTAGKYDVVVANSMGSVTSVVAQLTVGIPMANPSFEADSFLSWPGYSGPNPGGAGTDPGENGPITGWTQSNLDGTGINPISNGSSPFADNGVIPHGTNVAFMQADSTLSQTVTGLTVGTQYYLHYYENGRSGGIPSLEARLGGSTVVPAHAVPSGGGYRGIYSEVFTATTADLEVLFEKSNPQGGDTTVLIDNVAIVKVEAGTAPFLTKTPQSGVANPGEAVTFNGQAIGSLPLGYQWLKNGTAIAGANTPSLTLSNVRVSDEGDYTLRATNAFGTVTTPAAHLTVGLAGVFGTGVAANGSLLPAGEIDPHYKLIASADGGFPGPDAIVLNEGWPIQSGVWMLNGPNSKWIGPQADQSGAGGNAEGDYTYRTTFDLTGYDVSRIRVVGGWAADNSGLDILVNGTSSGLTSGGFGSFSSFTITNGLVAGKNTLDFKMNNLPATPNPTGLRVDLRAILVAVQTAPKMQIAFGAATGVTISWAPAAAGQKLQSAPAVSGPWTELVGAANPYTVTAPSTIQFFRVVAP